MRGIEVCRGGNLVQSIDRDGQEIDYAYDHLDRETAENWISATEPRTIATNYYNNGLVESVTDSGDASPQYVDYAYTYDSIGRLATVTSTGPAGTATVVLTAGYDGDGNRTSLSAAIEAPGASSFTPDFQNTYSYDALNEMLEVAQSAQSGGNAVAAKSAAFSYDAAGDLTAASRFQDAAAHTAAATDTTDLVARAAYGYDGDGRLTDLTYSLPASSSGTAPAYEWAYDAADRITEQSSRADTDTSASGYSAGDPATWAQATYNYDPAGQLTTATVNGTTTHAVTYSANWQNAPQVGSTPGAEDYNYDANGNEDGNGSVVSAPSSSTGDNQISSDGTYNYYYDNDGNLVQQVQCTGNTRTNQPHEVDYTYDFRDRLTEVTNKDSSGRVTQVVDYVYDAFNRLVGRTQANYTYTGDSRTPSSTVTATGHFVYDGDDITLVLDNTGAVTARVLYGPATDQVLAEEDVSPSSDVITWALTDNQNTVRDLAQYNATTGVTTIVDHREYTAFGQPISAPVVDFLFGYTARYYDAATGLQWNLNRWYNPSLQRWMGQDPDGLTSDANSYRYVLNNPANFVDACGLQQSPVPAGSAPAPQPTWGTFAKPWGSWQHRDLPLFGPIGDPQGLTKALADAILDTLSWEIPKALRDEMASKNLLVRVCRDAAELRRVSKITVSADMAGFYSQTLGAMVIFSQPLAGKSLGAVHYATRHEVGHVFSHIYGIMADQAFQQAYLADVRRIPWGRYKTLAAYFEDRQQVGSEVCADAFAYVLAPQGEKNDFLSLRRDVFVRSFPNVIAYMRQRVKLLANPPAPAAPGR